MNDKGEIYRLHEALGKTPEEIEQDKERLQKAVASGDATVLKRIQELEKEKKSL